MFADHIERVQSDKDLSLNERLLIEMIADPYQCIQIQHSNFLNYHDRLNLIKKFIHDNRLAKKIYGQFNVEIISCFQHPDFVEQLLVKIRDDLACARMLGGNSGAIRKNNAIVNFQMTLNLCKDLGLGRKGFIPVLEQVFDLDSTVYLSVLKAAASYEAFEVFSRQIDAAIAVNSKINQDSFILKGAITLFNYIYSPLFAIEDKHLALCIRIRQEMLNKSLIQRPDVHIISHVLEKYLPSSNFKETKQDDKPKFPEL